MAKEPKKLKLPKSLGACVDLYHALRAKRLEQDKVSKEMKVDETAVAEHLIAGIDKTTSIGVVGKDYKALVVTDVNYTVEDWDKFYNHIKKTGEFDLLNRAVNQAAVKARVADQVRPAGKKGETWKPKLPPGIKSFPILKLSVTKV